MTQPFAVAALLEYQTKSNREDKIKEKKTTTNTWIERAKAFKNMTMISIHYISIPQYIRYNPKLT